MIRFWRKKRWQAVNLFLKLSGRKHRVVIAEWTYSPAPWGLQDIRDADGGLDYANRLRRMADEIERKMKGRD